MRSADPARPRIRSALFIPAQRADFLERAAERSSDAVVLDLEDAVAADGKPSARSNAAAWLAERSTSRPFGMARVNSIDSGLLGADLEVIVGPALEAVLVPKIRSAEDVREVADRLSWLEGRNGVAHGRIAIWPIVETASAVTAIDEIARSSSRVAYLGGGTSEQGDLAREIGFEWTVDGLETLHIRSRVLIAARAAGLHNPMTGLVSTLAELQEVEQFARQARQLGYSGMMVIHPAHVAVVNAVFTPSERDVARAAAMMHALDDAAAHGDGAVAFEGRMVDVAMARTARLLMADAARVDELEHGAGQ